MKSILLIGLGRFGRHIAQELNELVLSPICAFVT
jgi:Trk K+ transport system NAD-binding subunit